MQQITLVFEPAEEGGYSAYVAEIPGVNSQGESLDEAREMVLEALRDLFEYRREIAEAKENVIREMVSLI